MSVPGSSQPFAGHILLDVPAEHPTLSFAQIAQALATIVQSSEPRFAVGIFGGWGSGKSTLMDEIERLVVGRNEAIVVRFNAWRYEREPHLIVPLLDTIRAGLAEWAAMPEHSGPERERVRSIAGRVGRVVRALVRATSVDIGLPGAASMSVDPGKALDELMAHPDDAASSPQSLYFAAFQELTEAFSQVKSAAVSRIVVFVDDLDRCLPERALTVLESMKLFFDMPGFVFVVGLDERVVESAVRSKFAARGQDDEELDRQLEREYLKKIFQVPYTLPPLVPGQVKELLAWLHQYGHLGDDQRVDLAQRVRRYLGYVATEGRVNPRELKRFINAYTLQRMIRPDLDPDTMLALQTIDFRPDWERLYEDVILAEPDLFGDALASYAAGQDHAFEDLWPDVGVLPLELSAFLRSQEAEALKRPDLERYVSFMETTRTTQHWVKDAMADVGMLRRLLLSIGPDMEFGSDAARTATEHAKDILGRLGNYRSRMSVAALERPLARLTVLVDQLALPANAEVNADQLDRWRRDVQAHTDALRQELRFIRRSSTFAS